jgi:hypothetical protein
MDTMKGKSETLIYATAHPSSRRRRRRSREDQVASPEEWRDWSSLPRDVLSVVFSKLPQTDVLRAAGFVCSPWPRLALEEPQMWHHIDLREGQLWDGHEQPPAGWKAMALAAVDLSAGQCESFKGHVDTDVLGHLANRHVYLFSFPHRVVCVDPNYLQQR